MPKQLISADTPSSSAETTLYDLGDAEHNLLLEAILLSETRNIGRASAASAARPPKDVGGTSGYGEYLAMLVDGCKLCKLLQPIEPDSGRHPVSKRSLAKLKSPKWLRTLSTGKYSSKPPSQASYRYNVGLAYFTALSG
jgi:hypothetical protein